MISYHRRRGETAKLQPKFASPYCMAAVMPNHAYMVERLVEMSIQNEAHLKPY